MLDERESIGRRNLLRAGVLAATVGVSGCLGLGSDEATDDRDEPGDDTDEPTDETTAEATEPAESATSTTMPEPAFSESFEGAVSDLDSRGWTVTGSFSTSDSVVTATSDGNHFLKHSLPASSGTLRFSGTRNNSKGRGLKLMLVRNPEAGKGNYEGYRLNIGQIPDDQGADDNTVDFVRLNPDGDNVNLVDSDFTHEGTPHDYTIERSSDGQFAVAVDGTELGTASDDAVTDLTHIVLRFDGAEQSMDGVSFRT